MYSEAYAECIDGFAKLREFIQKKNGNELRVCTEK